MLVMLVALLPACQRGLQRCHIIRHGGDGDGVIEVRVERVHVGPGSGKALHDFGIADKGCNMKRRAAIGVARIDICA